MAYILIIMNDLIIICLFSKYMLSFPFFCPISYLHHSLFMSNYDPHTHIILFQSHFHIYIDTNSRHFHIYIDTLYYLARDNTKKNMFDSLKSNIPYRRKLFSFIKLLPLHIYLAAFLCASWCNC